MTGEISLRPQWSTLPRERQAGFVESWYLKLNDREGKNALWLRFVIHSSQNGFRRMVETWAVSFSRADGRDPSKVAIKQSYELSDLTHQDDLLQVGECSISQEKSQGSVQSKGSSIRWNLNFQPASDAHYSLVPRLLLKTHLVRNRVFTWQSDLRFSGTTEVNGEKREWTEAPGMMGHLWGPRLPNYWVWGHCNAFVNEQGLTEDFVFEGLNGSARLGPVSSPPLSSFYFRYRGKEYHFTTLRDALLSQSQNSLNEWTFKAERGDLIFRGYAHAEYRDFAGLTFEDTDGSLLYCANTKIATMKILVYRRGKLEATLNAPGTAAFEVVSRTKNPYVPLVL